MNYLLFEELCKTNNTTPTALSKKIGLSKGNTSNWKNGGNPSADILCKIADELNCTTDALLGRTECKSTVSSSFSNNNIAYGNNSKVQVTHNNENIEDEICRELSKVIKSLPLKERSELITMIYNYAEKYNKSEK